MRRIKISKQITTDQLIKKSKNIKRIVALLMVSVMSVSCTGCAKKDKKKDKKEADDYFYKTSIEMKFDYKIEKQYIYDGILYGLWQKENITERLAEYDVETEYGLVKYNLATKEKTEVPIETDGDAGSMYFESKDKICVQVFNRESELGEDFEENIYVYNQDLELISKDETDHNKVINIGSSILCEDGRILKVVSDKNAIPSKLSVEDSEGNELQSISLAGYYGTDIVQVDTNEFVIKTSGGSGNEFYMLDLKKGEIGEKLEGTDKFYNTFVINSGINHSLLISMGGELYEYDIDKKEDVTLLNYLESGINETFVSYVFTVDENTYGVMLTSYDGEWSELDYLTKQDKAEMEEREEIVYGTFGGNCPLEKILEFNRTNDKYKIVVIDFMDNSYELGKSPVDNFDEAVALGNVPDIISLDMLDTGKYAKLGVLEDLTPYLEEDEEIHEEDFFESVLDACRYDGKLYTIPEAITFNVWIGNGELAGYDTTWNIDEFIHFANSLPEEVELYDSITKENMLSNMILYDTKEYVDWSTSSCNFNSDRFINILKLCDNYPLASEGIMNHFTDEEDGVTEGVEARMLNGKIALSDFPISGMSEYMRYKAILGNKLSFKGHPTDSGSGVSISFLSADKMAISATSRHKEVVWEFLRQFYTKEVQADRVYGFSSRKDACENYLNKCKNLPLLTDENGREYYYRIEVSEGKYLYVDECTEKDIQTILGLIENVDRVSFDTDSYIMEFVNDEVAAFFEGQKTAEEVAEIIQSRVSVYVNENS